MLKQKIFFLIFIFSLLLPLQNALADTGTTTPATTTSITLLPNASSTQGSVLGVQAPTIPTIITAVKAAKIQLANVTLNHSLAAVYKKNTKKILRYNLTSKDIALAILDPSTNSTIITIGRQSGKSMVFPDSAVDVNLVKFNGVNSKFSVNKPVGGTIVALKYLISNPDSGSKAKIEAGLSPSIYVPYSDAFSQPDVIAYGGAYLDGIIAKVTTDLKYLHSNSIPGKDLTDAIPPAMIKSLVYAEHTDTNKVLNGGDTQGTINQLNILFALNEGDAFKYSVSTAAARGISQFIPSTYASLVARHPEAGLIADFVAGMSDHENSIKAMYLLLDDYAGDIRIKAANGFTEGHVFEYGAASYNGGTTRVANAVKTFGTDWNLDHSGQINSLAGQVSSLKYQIKKTANTKAKVDLKNQLADATVQLSNMKSASLKNETVNYLNKIFKVIQYFNSQQLAVK